jgi:hypothetical protein
MNDAAVTMIATCLMLNPTCPANEYPVCTVNGTPICVKGEYPVAANHLCSDDNRVWWPARSDGMCYFDDKPKVPSDAK